MEESRRLGLRQALAIAAVALAVRLGVAEELRHTILYQFPQLDAMEFLRWGRRVASGTYVVRLTSPDFAEARTVTLAK